MKIFNVIWLDNHVEPDVQNFYHFENALRSVNNDLLNYEKRYGYKPEVYALEDNHLFARMEDVFEVEIVEHEIK